jgi:ATP-binding cassette subfamily B protein/subfamily B ATP-binding cassette protein MsbA
MKNFWRALRIASTQRLNIIACLVTGVLVAVLWGGNLAVIYPVVDIIMTDRAIPQWIDDEIAESEANVAKYTNQLAELRLKLEAAADDQKLILRADIAETEYQINVYRQRAQKFRWAAPWAHHWLPTTPFDTLLLVCLFVAGLTMLRNAIRIFNQVFVARLGYVVGFGLRKQFYEKMLRLDMADFSEQGRGDLMNRCTSDLNATSHGVQILVGQALLEPLKGVMCFGIAAWINWRLLLLTILVVPPIGYGIHWLAKALKRAHRNAMQELSQIYESLSETLSGIKLIKAFTMEPAERGRFRKTSKLFYRRQMKIAGYNALVSPVTEIAGVGMILVAALIGGFLVLNRETHILGLKISDVPLTHGMMSVFFAMLAGMSDPARRLSTLFNQLQQAVAAADRVYEVLDREPKITDPPNPVPLPRLSRSIRFENINFHYHSEKSVLEEINLEIRRGETLAIVGPNGCGKSTLLSLLLRFYDPVEGRVLLDGIDIRDVRLHDLRVQTGLVSQETLLFNDTVANNIAYGALDATQLSIEGAARKAFAHAFITEKLSDGYQTIVGPSGNRLSGGQRQRISLARAILRNPEILLLDEATSQIDLESEQLIHKVLDEFMRDRTAIVVTHRMSTISLADRIAVMDLGRILDVGTHQELVGRCPLYQRLSDLGYRESA